MICFARTTGWAAASLAAGVLGLAASAAWAQDPFHDALELLERDAPAGIAAFEALAAAGDVEALNVLAITISNPPDGVEADVPRAMRLWEEAAAGGSQAASLNLGVRLLRNSDLEDDAHAVALLESVVHPELARVAAHDLGRAYLFGLGVETDFPRAAALMTEAVEHAPDDPDARYLLGRVYQNGWGVPADPVEAYRHLKVAADTGDRRAQWQVGMMLLNGDGVAANPRLARAYVRVSAEAEYTPGMISLAVMLSLGEGGEIDAVEAREWYRRAAIGGSAHALRSLGAMLFTGEGGPAEREAGAAYLDLAARGGDDQAPLLLERFADEIAGLDPVLIAEAKNLWVRDHGVPGRP